MVQTILRLAAVRRATGLSKSAIYSKIGDGVFPRPIQLGKQARGWLESDIAEWQKARIAERDSQAA